MFKQKIIEIYRPVINLVLNNRKNIQIGLWGLVAILILLSIGSGGIIGIMPVLGVIAVIAIFRKAILSIIMVISFIALIIGLFSQDIYIAGISLLFLVLSPIIGLAFFPDILDEDGIPVRIID